MALDFEQVRKKWTIENRAAVAGQDRDDVSAVAFQIFDDFIQRHHPVAVFAQLLQREHTLATVSYTHLDVYKRQIL